MSVEYPKPAVHGTVKSTHKVGYISIIQRNLTLTSRIPGRNRVKRIVVTQVAAFLNLNVNSPTMTFSETHWSDDSITSGRNMEQRRSKSLDIAPRGHRWREVSHFIFEIYSHVTNYYLAA